jgi:hypothetical protein
MSPIDDADLPDHLARLAAQLADRAPTGSDGAPAELVALMPAEPVVGEVAVACWADRDGNEQFDLVALADGAPNTDHTALREALALLAMTETLEELASFDTLATCRDELQTWVRSMAGVGADVEPSLREHIDRAAAALDALASLAPPATGRVARTTQLDTIGEALRVLENQWQLLEQAAELWSDAQLADADAPDHSDRVDRVRHLWQALSRARRGPLATNPATAVHAGREAGVALAKAIVDAGRD